MRLAELFRSDRRFRMWSYEVGHLTLLLRSVKELGLPTRVDVRFVDVRSIDLPTKLEGVALFVETEVGSSPHELAQDGITPGDRAGPYADGRRIVLRGANYEGSVVAGAVAVHEDTGEFNEPAYWDEARCDS